MSSHERLGEPSALYFKTTYVVQESDIDGLGHMNNTVYLRLMENLAWAHSKHLGLGVEEFQRIGCAFQLHRDDHSECRQSLRRHIRWVDGHESFIIQLLSTPNHINYET